MKSTNTSENTSPDIGAILKKHIKKHKIFKSSLARYLKRSAPAIEYHMRRPTMQTKILWEISIALKHNFFSDIAAQLPAEFTNNVLIDTSKDEEITRLNEKTKLLEAKLEAYEKVLGARK